MTPNWEKPRKLVTISDAYAADAAIAATSVPRQVPPSAQRSASSGSSPRARCSS